MSFNSIKNKLWTSGLLTVVITWPNLASLGRNWDQKPQFSKKKLVKKM